MSKKIIKITESDIKQIISEAVKEIIKEYGDSNKSIKQIGRLVTRLQNRGEYRNASEKTSYADRKIKDNANRYTNEWLRNRALRRGNNAYLTGRGI